MSRNRSERVGSDGGGVGGVEDVDEQVEVQVQSGFSAVCLVEARNSSGNVYGFVFSYDALEARSFLKVQCRVIGQRKMELRQVHWGNVTVVNVATVGFCTIDTGNRRVGTSDVKRWSIYDVAICAVFHQCRHCETAGVVPAIKVHTTNNRRGA